jgi:short-subunit dehydrogenase
MRKLVVITGGTKGIGLALVHKFAERGFDIVTCSRNEADLNLLKNFVNDKYKDITIDIFKADLSTRTQARDFGSFINAQGRSVGVLVNNAGQFIPGEMHNEEEGVFEQMMATNLYSAYYLTRELVHHMKSDRSGHIFNICSVASLIAYPNGGSYGVSKAALLALTKSLRQELRVFGIRVTAVMPGATFTASWDGVDLPQDRFMPPTDIAEMIFSAYSLSDRSVVEDIVIRPQMGDI